MGHVWRLINQLFCPLYMYMYIHVEGLFCLLSFVERFFCLRGSQSSEIIESSSVLCRKVYYTVSLSQRFH